MRATAAWLLEAGVGSVLDFFVGGALGVRRCWENRIFIPALISGLWFFANAQLLGTIEDLENVQHGGIDGCEGPFHGAEAKVDIGDHIYVLLYGVQSG